MAKKPLKSKAKPAPRKRAPPKRTPAAKPKAKPEAKRGRGRPSKYDPAMCKQVQNYAKLGATELEIADFLGVSVRSVAVWKSEHPEFLHALKAGKDQADQRVVNSLYAKAIGYSHDAVKIFMPAGAPAPVYAPYREHVPPDTTACIFWLKNRDPENWRDKQEVEHSVTNLAELLKQRRQRARKPNGGDS